MGPGVVGAKAVVDVVEVEGSEAGKAKVVVEKEVLMEEDSPLWVADSVTAVVAGRVMEGMAVAMAAEEVVDAGIVLGVHHNRHNPYQMCKHC